MVLQPFCFLGQVSRMEFLMDNPVEINTVDRSVLEELMLLSDFQLESLMEYREKSGNILSATELALLPGFDRAVVDELLPYITFQVKDRLSRGGRWRGELAMKSSGAYVRDTSLLGSPYSMQLRFKSEYGEHLSGGFLLESDAGEYLFKSGYPFVDFTSFHVALKDYRAVKCLVAGDYSVRFAQGLVAWNSFSLSGIQNPSSMVRRGVGISPYTSADEDNFYRGAAVSLSFGRLGVVAFGSYKKVDARIKDGKYTSLPEDGLHNTASSLVARKTMGECVAGGNVSYVLDGLKLELSGLCYGYDKVNGLPVKEYNKYRLYDGWWGNFSVGVYGVFRRGQAYGEFAVDMGGSTALLAGSVFRCADRFELGVQARRYSRSYIAPYANGYSTISDVANQTGITLSCKYPVTRLLSFTFMADAVHYPWKRYNVDTASSQIKGGVAGRYTPGKWNFSTDITYRYTTHNAMHRAYLKGEAGYSFSPGFHLKVKGAVVSCFQGVSEPDCGWMAALVAKYCFNGEKSTLQLGLTCYNCRSWDVRLYNYEQDVPYTYNSRLLYGVGGGWYFLLKQKLFRNMYLYFKSDTSKLKLAVKYRF